MLVNESGYYWCCVLSDYLFLIFVQSKSTVQLFSVSITLLASIMALFLNFVIDFYFFNFFNCHIVVKD